MLFTSRSEWPNLWGMPEWHIGPWKGRCPGILDSNFKQTRDSGFNRWDSGFRFGLAGPYILLCKHQDENTHAILPAYITCPIKVMLTGKIWSIIQRIFWIGQNFTKYLYCRVHLHITLKKQALWIYFTYHKFCGLVPNKWQHISDEKKKGKKITKDNDNCEVGFPPNLK